jgi:hypothetical protein
MQQQQQQHKILPPAARLFFSRARFTFSSRNLIILVKRFPSLLAVHHHLGPVIWYVALPRGQINK